MERQPLDARCYQELLSGLPLTLPTLFADSEPVWHLYVVEHPQRELLRQKLAEAGIETGLHYPVPVHLQKAYAALGHRRGDFPLSERLADQCLTLPMFAELAKAQIRSVSLALHSILR